MQIVNCKLQNEEAWAIRILQYLSRSAIVLVLFSVSAVAGVNTSDPAPIFPKALARGDTVEIIAPAKYLDKDRICLAKKRLEAMGFHVRLPKDLFRHHGFLAGTDEERATQLMEAFTDPDVRAVMPGTGGYGCTRILDKLDYDAIRRNPKILIGFSDITALHVAINQQTGLVTFHSPVPEYGLGNDDGMPPFAARWFWRAILAKCYPPGETGYTIITRPGKFKMPEDAKLYKDMPKLVTMHGGKARGRLIGGNLSVIHAMMGTPYEIQTDGKILFLEDVGEAPYRIDRMLTTLRQAGKFDHAAGIILCQFSTRKDEAKWDDDESMDDVLRDIFGKVNVPVLSGFPAGHVKFNGTLPEGAMAELDAGAQTVRVLENPVVVR